MNKIINITGTAINIVFLILIAMGWYTLLSVDLFLSLLLLMVYSIIWIVHLVTDIDVHRYKTDEWMSFTKFSPFFLIALLLIKFKKA